MTGLAYIQNILSSMAVISMITVPLGQAKAAEKQARFENQMLVHEVSTSQVNQSLQTLGLQKSMTLGEFYKRNKNLFPERIQASLDQYVQSFANTVMPEFTVTEVVGSDGKKVPVLKMDSESELVNIQIYGGTDKFAKFGNTNLSQIDILSFDDMVSKVFNGDAARRKGVINPQSQSQALQYPMIDKISWKKMTSQNRAEYMMNMYRMWSDAREVLYQKYLTSRKNPAKRSAIEKTDLFWQRLFTSLVGEVNAATKAGPFNPDDACIVAGYIAKYGSDYCDHTKLRESYNSGEGTLFKAAMDVCKPLGQIACNPLVFGTPGGKPTCVKPSRTGDFQVATHWNGPCDSKSLLSKTEIPFLKDNTKHVGRYDSANMVSDSELKEKIKSEQGKDLELTKDYVNGVMQFRNKKLSDLFMAGNITDEVIAELTFINKYFNQEIKQAHEACVAATQKETSHETNFWGACDQLHRRALFIADYLTMHPGCPSGGSVDSSTLKCICPAGATPVNPGKTCSAAQSPPQNNGGGGGQQQPPSADCPGGAKGVKMSDPKGAEFVQCSDGSMPAKKKGGGILGFLKSALPWIAGAGVLFLMYKLWSVPKPKLNAAKDPCANGATTTCTQSCSGNQTRINGVCGCPACVPGQTLTNALTCTCSTTSTTDPQLITCPDGVTKKATLAECPATQYTCWDGSTVTNPLNCPEKPSTTTNKTSTGK